MYCDAQVCVSPNGLPVSVDAEIESKNVTLALFDVFFGNAPVSPSLKDSVANGLSHYSSSCYELVSLKIFW